MVANIHCSVAAWKAAVANWLHTMILTLLVPAEYCKFVTNHIFVLSFYAKQVSEVPSIDAVMQLWHINKLPEKRFLLQLKFCDH